MTPWDRPIPIGARAPDAGDYRDIPIDRSDPRYTEPLVDARAHGIAGENYYARADGQNRPYREAVPGAVRQLWCRKSVVAMLAEVNAQLADYGAELYLWDAYRPVACQKALWAFYWDRFRKRTPDADAAALAAHVCRYVSDPRHFDPDDQRT